MVWGVKQVRQLQCVYPWLNWLRFEFSASSKNLAPPYHLSGIPASTKWDELENKNTDGISPNFPNVCIHFWKYHLYFLETSRVSALASTHESFRWSNWRLGSPGWSWGRSRPPRQSRWRKERRGRTLRIEAWLWILSTGSWRQDWIREKSRMQQFPWVKKDCDKI